MMTKTLAAALACLPVALPLAALAQGPLNPPGPPAPTMKSLDELDAKLNQANTKLEQVDAKQTAADTKAEKRIPISTLPFTINEPGSYYLTGNLTHNAATNGITVNATNVTVDLNGFTLANSMAGSGFGIVAPLVSPESGRITVRNGFVRGWSVGVNLDGRFNRIEGVTASNNAQGIDCETSCVVVDCVAGANTGSGIRLGGDGVVVRSVARENGGDGFFTLFGSLVVQSTARNNTGRGFLLGSGSTVQECTAYANSSVGIDASDSFVTRCMARRNTGDGIRVSGTSFVLENNCSLNGGGDGDGAGIHATGSTNRIEGNNVTGNDRGIDVDSGRNVIIKNSASSNAVRNYSIAANNVFGAIVDRTAPASAAVEGNSALSSAGTTDPWANFSY